MRLRYGLEVIAPKSLPLMSIAMLKFLFMVTFGPESNLYLEGEIDGLACDFLIEEATDQPLDKRIAYLIDYKQGKSFRN